MSASDFLADHFRDAVGSIFVTSLPNERNGGKPAEICGRGGGAQLDARIDSWDRPGRGTFFCVNALAPRQARRSKETVFEIVCLHADIDFNKIDMAPDAVLEHLGQLPCLPSKVVHSGHGFHCHWMLREPERATPETITHVEGLLRQLADVVGGDPAVCEVARLMRLPGSHNTKNGERLPVRVVVDRPIRYELDDLAEWLETQRPLIPRRGAAPAQTNPFLTAAGMMPCAGGEPIDVPARLTAMRFQGAGDTSIHATQLSATAAMMSRGEDVEGIVLTVMMATRRAAGTAGERWNWGAEERGIRAMCASWARKKVNGQLPAQTNSPRAFNAMELDPMQFNEIKYVVPGYIVEGLTLFAGKPKIGKSWLLLHAAHAVATGGTTLGDVRCEPGSVLYAALEDSPRRLQARMRKLFPHTPWSAQMHYVTEMPRLTEGGLDYIKSWVEGAGQPRLVIIDTLAMVRMPNRRDLTAYDADYEAVRALRDLAHAKGVAIVLVHHLRKAEADDAYDTVSGTLGLTGAPDTVMILGRVGEGTVLRARGRDLEPIEKAAVFDAATCTWSILGEAKVVQQTAERASIVEALGEAGEEPLGANQVATACGMRAANVRRLLGKLKREGVVKAAKRGRYVLSR